MEDDELVWYLLTLRGVWKVNTGNAHGVGESRDLQLNSIFRTEGEVKSFT